MVFKVAKKKLTDKNKYAPRTMGFLLKTLRRPGILYGDVTNFSQMGRDIKSIHFNEQGFSQTTTIHTVWQVDKVNR